MSSTHLLSRPSQRRLVAVCGLLLSFLFATAPVSAQGEPQDPKPAETQDPKPAESQGDPIPTPESLDAVKEVALDDLKDSLEGKGAEQLTAALNVWLARLEEADKEFLDAIGEKSDLAKVTPLRTRLERILTIAETIEVPLESMEGAEIPTDYERLTGKVEKDLAEYDQKQQDVSQLTTAQALAIDPDVLDARLRPLKKEDVEALIEPWRAILQKKAEELRTLEIADIEANKTGDDDGVEQANEDLVARRKERDDLRKRFYIVLDAFEAKGGDAAGYRAYAESLSAPVKLTGFLSAWVQAKAWLLSKDGGQALLLDIIAFFGILIAFRFVGAFVGKIVDRALKSMKKTPELLRNFIINSVRKVIGFVGLVVALGQLGVDIGPFLAAMGAAGFVIGFALQGTLSNFASGVMVMIYRPYDVGDIVNAAGVTGSVKSMNLVSTTIATFDNQTIVVPNSKIWGDVITNVTANNTRRVDMTFGIGYADDIEKALQVLNDIVSKHEKVLSTPAPTIKLHELGDSSVNFVCRPWSKTSDYWDVYWDITRTVKERFDAENISIPFPQRDVHVHQVTDGDASKSA